MDTTQIATLAALVGAIVLVAGGIGWSRLRGSTAVTYIAIWLGLAVVLALLYRMFG